MCIIGGVIFFTVRSDKYAETEKYQFNCRKYTESCDYQRQLIMQSLRKPNLCLSLKCLSTATPRWTTRHSRTTTRTLSATPSPTDPWTSTSQMLRCDITAHTVLLYVLFCLTYMYCTLYHRHRYIVHIVHVPCFPVSDVEVSSSTSVHHTYSHFIKYSHLYLFTL